MRSVLFLFHLTLPERNVANDIYLSFVDLDDLTGAELHKRTLDSYFFTVERLYQTGARAFVFNGLLPFDRAQFGISQGAELQAKLKVGALFVGSPNRMMNLDLGTHRRLQHAARSSSQDLLRIEE